MGCIPAAAAVAVLVGRLLVPAGSQEPLAVGGIQLVAVGGIQLVAVGGVQLVAVGGSLLAGVVGSPCAVVRHTTTHKVISGA